MRAILAATLFTAGVAYAQLPPASPPQTETTPASAAPSSRSEALEILMSERDSEEVFAKAIEDARKQGIKDQVILEARFLFHVDRNEDDAIAAMLPEFLKQKETFKVADSEIFSVEEDWLAVVEYVQAIALLKKGDKAGFKQHITEAFWLSPRQGSAFATHIERMRLEDAMNAVKLDMETRLAPLLANGSAVSLDALLKGRKALVLHFWSPWNQESAESMLDFVITAKKLTDSELAVLSIIPDSDPKMIEDARTLLQPLGATPPGSWAIDNKENALNRTLRVQTLPTMVILSPEGKVLFNGHPSDNDFWSALNKINPAIVRPDTPPAPDKK